MPSAAALRPGSPHGNLGRCVPHGADAGRGHAGQRLPAQKRGLVRGGVLPSAPHPCDGYPADLRVCFPPLERVLSAPARLQFVCDPSLRSPSYRPSSGRTELANLEEMLALKKTELRKQVHTQGLPHARLWGHAYPGWIVSEGPGLGPSDKGEPGGCTGTWGPNQEPCGMACMPLSTFCHECILNDPLQVYSRSHFCL